MTPAHDLQSQVAWEMAAIRDEIARLRARVDRLEQENTDLWAEIAVHRTRDHDYQWPSWRDAKRDLHAAVTGNGRR